MGLRQYDGTPRAALYARWQAARALPWAAHFATLFTMSQVRVVTSLPNVFSMSAMNNALRALGT